MKSAFLIANYNKQAYLAYCLESCLNQKDINGNLIDNHIFIIDDCSTDNSVNIIEYFKKDYPTKLHFKKNNKNEGVGITYNKLIDDVIEYNTFCVNKDDMIDFIVYFGSDDVACECLISNAENGFNKSNADIVYQSFRIVDCMFNHIQEKITLPFDEGIKNLYKEKGQFIGHGGLAVKTTAFDVRFSENKVGVDHKYIIDLVDSGKTFYKTEDIIENGKLLNCSFYYILNPSSISISRYDEVSTMDKKYFELGRRS